MKKHLKGILVTVLAAAFILVVGCSGGTLTETSETPSVESAVAMVSPSVVHIVADYGNWHSSGTGIVIDAAGYILTNNHVVEKGYYAMVLLPGKGQVKAEIVYRDQSRDLAILKCPSGSYPAIVLGSIREPSLGEEVIAMGFPSASVIGDSVSISKGIISAFRTIDEINYIQTDASLNPGSSGGPLINLYGEVIGINTWKLTETEGINFAIKVDSIKAYVENILQQLMDGRLSPPNLPAQKAVVPTEGIAFQYHGIGSTRTPTFNIAASSSPWKMFFKPEWDGIAYVWVERPSDIPQNRSMLGEPSARIMQMEVTAGRLYETYVYAHTGATLVIGVETAPPEASWTVWVVDEPVTVASVPFTFDGEGGVMTPPFIMKASTRYKLTFTTSWDGDFGFGFYDIENNHVWAMGRSTGSWADFPDSVKAGETYEWIFDWKHPSQAAYLHIEGVPPKGVPPISKWTISISPVGALTVIPPLLVDITVVVEYAGEWNGELKGGSGIVTSGNQSLVWENIEVPVEYTARKTDGGAGPLELTIIYNGQVVAQDTAMGEDNEASVYWEGPQ